MTEIYELDRIQMFSQLSIEAKQEVKAVMRTRPLAAGELLFNLGDPGDEMYIVQTGRVAIFMPSEKSEEERPVRIFTPQQALGEMALIDGQPRSMSARALEPSEVLVLAGDDFRDLLRRQPDLALAVMAGLNDRIRYTTEFLGEVQGWVKRVAEGKYDRQFSASADYQDNSIAALAAEFSQMAAQVRQREEQLRQELTQLRIEIDQSKKEREVSEIVESDFFQDLASRAKQLRKNK
jgi:CRP/FNR family transcriptional regulator